MARRPSLPTVALCAAAAMWSCSLATGEGSHVPALHRYFRGKVKPKPTKTVARRGAATVKERPPKVTAKKAQGYLDRFRALLARTDPRMVLIGRSEAQRAVWLLQQEAANQGSVVAEELEDAQHIVSATVHPAGYLIPWPLRLAAFPWLNLPLVVATLAAKSARGLLAVQLANQALLAFFNLAHSPSSRAVMDTLVAFRSFMAATCTAGLVSVLGYHFMAQGALMDPRTSWFVPYLSIASANVVNLVLARQEELVKGLPVTDGYGRQLARSTAAGRAALLKAVVTRALLLPLVALLVPAALGGLLEAIAPSSSSAGVDALCTAATVAVGLPACAALFPERVSLRVGALESAAQGKVHASAPQEPPDKVFVYRGL